jgi:hypothetical protein
VRLLERFGVFSTSEVHAAMDALATVGPDQKLCLAPLSTAAEMC